MKKSRLLTLSGISFLAVGSLFVAYFAWAIYTSVYNCEHLTGFVPVQGCEYFLQLPFYQWSGSSILLSGVSLAAIGSGLILLGRFSSRHT